jgi:hypothetical protein
LIAVRGAAGALVCCADALGDARTDDKPAILRTAAHVAIEDVKGWGKSEGSGVIRRHVVATPAMCMCSV